MTSDDIKKLHADLAKLTHAMENTAVGGSKESRLTEALRETVDPSCVKALSEMLEHAYGILAMKGALDASKP